MDRNLGATRVATSSFDFDSYGSLYQWGRGSDGHQKITFPTTATLSTGDVPGHANFITTNSSPYDWRSPQKDNLWQGVNGVNNPCPAGYRIPTQTELNAEILIFQKKRADGAFASVLKLPLGGYRNKYNGSVDFGGMFGQYWTSTVSGSDSVLLFFYNNNMYFMTVSRGFGNSVRCLKN